MKTNSIALRLIAGAALWVGLALVVGGFALAALFDDHVERTFDRRASVLLESLIAVAEIDPAGKLVLTGAPGEPRFDVPFSGWYWQIDGPDGEVLHSRSLWDRTLGNGAPAGAISTYRIAGPAEQTLRVTERGITLPGSRAIFRFAVAADIAQLEAETRPFNVVLGLSLGILWLVLMAAVALQVHFGLRPLKRLQAGLAEIRAGHSDRLAEDFPAEVAPLAAEVNALMGQISRVVERARTHAGNLAHALKTPLSVISNEIQVSDGPLAETVRREAETMRRSVDHHLARARAAATASVIGARTDVAPVIEDLRRTLVRIHAAREVEIEIEVADGAAFRGDRHDLEEMIGNIVDNGCKWAHRLVRIGVVEEDGALRIRVEDDGEGLPPERRNEALGRGKRLDETVPGSGLGLSIVRDIAGLYDGRLELDRSELGGLRVDLFLPRAE